MGRDELIGRLSSSELSAWSVLFGVQDEERAAAEEAARLKATSDDGEVIAYGEMPSQFGEDEDD